MKKSMRLSSLTMIAIGITAVTAVAVSMFCFAGAYNRALKRDAGIGAEQAVQQVSQTVESYLDGLKTQLDNISEQILKSGDLEEIKQTISVAASLQNDIVAVVLYDQNGRILVVGSDGQTLKKNPVYSFTPKIDYAISAPHVQSLFENYYPWVVSLGRTEKSDILGEIYIAIDFSFSVMAGHIDHVGVGQRGYCYVVDTEGSIVYHPQQQLLYSGLRDSDFSFLKELSDGVHIQKDVLYNLVTLEDSSWRIVGVSYLSERLAQGRQTIAWVVLLSFLCCAFVATIILLIYAKIVTRPVRAIAQAMREFEQNADHYRYLHEENRVTELDQLSGSFEHMVSMIQELMERVRAEEKTLRKTQLKALQAQINPHFLYNTLDSIQWMCERGKNEDAVKMVGALAKLFRISISRGHELIPLRDEMRHAENYLLIQSYRYKDKFTYHFDIDSTLEDCLCNKITVQPIVENAIYHGIEPMIDEGEIRVTVRADDNGDILIEVSDNGVGMTEEQCAAILKKERSDSSGIGIKNVNDRLRIYFGEQYGISIKSELDEGTTITVRIPQLRKGQVDEV